MSSEAERSEHRDTANTCRGKHTLADTIYMPQHRFRVPSVLESDSSPSEGSARNSPHSPSVSSALELHDFDFSQLSLSPAWTNGDQDCSSMTRAEDESDYDSDNVDGQDGGVFLAEFDDNKMELDGKSVESDFRDEMTQARPNNLYPLNHDFTRVELVEEIIEESARITGGSHLSAQDSAGNTLSATRNHNFFDQIRVSPNLPSTNAGIEFNDGENTGDQTLAVLPLLTFTNPQNDETEHTQLTGPDIGPIDIDLPTMSNLTEENDESQDSHGLEHQEDSAAEDLDELLPIHHTHSDIMAHIPDDIFFAPNDESANFDFLELLQFWRSTYDNQFPERHPHNQDLFPPLSSQSVFEARLRQTTRRIWRNDLEREGYDLQGIRWKNFEISEREARSVRLRTYFNHTNILTHPKKRPVNNRLMFTSAPYVNEANRLGATSIPETENYFRFGVFSPKHRIPIAHFQLRHVISASSKNAVFFPAYGLSSNGTVYNGTTITCLNPEFEDDEYVLDTSKAGPESESGGMKRISTLAATNGVLVAGGFDGEYALKSLSSTPESPFTSGIITRHESSSTNHIHTFLDRRSGLPQAVFSSNDDHIRTLDCATNTFVGQHHHNAAVNCAVTSPDGRLRLMVRDNVHPMLVEANSGKPISELSGHSDYGFACDWSEDGVHMATGAQDGIVQIWDARKWRQPIQTLAADLGSVRTMAFSPLGSGKNVLVLAESADFIHVVNADTFSTKQTLHFFGEIGGISFVPDGSKLFVANGDSGFGGLIEYERAGYAERFCARDKLDWLLEGDFGDDERVLLAESSRRRRGLELRKLFL